MERSDEAVYVSIEEESHRDWDSLARLKSRLLWTPRSVIVLTMSRRNGSIFLAFEVAECMARRWRGVINWGGLDQWEAWFLEWEQSRSNRES